VDDEAIRALVTRLARPHASGGDVVERVAILAEGDGFAQVMKWIEEHGGKPEEAVATSPRGARHGLHGQRLADTIRPGSEKPRRFVLPPGALA
jgi:FAD/FMN-containing dehydrogenase